MSKYNATKLIKGWGSKLAEYEITGKKLLKACLRNTDYLGLY